MTGSTQDEDPRTPEQLRGDMQAIRKAHLSVSERATVQGLITQVQVLKQQLVTTHEQMQNLIHLYGTLRDQFKQFQEQRVKELQARGTGSTTPADQ